MRCPLRYSVGIQYAAVSSDGSHVVPECVRLLTVENASVDQAPLNSCEWAAPGMPGNTAGSSLAVCDGMHEAAKIALAAYA